LINFIQHMVIHMNGMVTKLIIGQELQGTHL